MKFAPSGDMATPKGLRRGSIKAPFDGDMRRTWAIQQTGAVIHVTTIAARVTKDAIEMASDSQLTGSHIAQHNYTKIYHIAGALVGISGGAAACEDFVEWFRKGAKRKKFPVSCECEFSGCHALVATRTGCKVFECSPVPVSTGKIDATGSGGGFAIAAMLAGASVRDSVKVAAKLDPHTGGRITVKRIEL